MRAIENYVAGIVVDIAVFTNVLNNPFASIGPDRKHDLASVQIVL